MKIRFAITLLLAVLACACSTTDYRSHKKVTQGIDYSRYPGNEVYYEFTSDIPTDPSVLGEDVSASASEEVLGEDGPFRVAQGNDGISKIVGQSLYRGTQKIPPGWVYICHEQCGGGESLVRC